MIELFYWPTPNGKKVTILLEELGLPYEITPLNIGRGDQFSERFLAINPNHRMPALVDHAPHEHGSKGGDGEPVTVFESGAILLYLAEKTGRFWPQGDLHAKYEVVEWVVWQMANQGPKFGERGHFARLGPEAGDLTYARRRFDDEVHRIYGVMNNRLYDRPYLAGADYSVADIAAYPWTVGWKQQGIDLDEFRHVKRWFEVVSARPAVQRGLAVTAGEPEDPASLSPEEQARRRRILFNQRARPAPA